MTPDASPATDDASPTPAPRGRRRADPVTFRPARTDELEACAEIWRVSINDYIRPLGQPDVPSEVAPLLRLYGHLQGTDPERFVVATTPVEHGSERILGFAAAAMRERLWFLSMCFVLPEAQGAGIGRMLLEQVGPPPGLDAVRSTATDSVQPISNALYASLGIVPRIPLLNLVGHPVRPEAFGSLPAAIRPVPFEDLAADPDGDGHARLSAFVDELDRELLGVAHPHDHRWLRREGRRGWLYLGPDGVPIAYGYGTEAGRIGPVASRDGDLVAPILGHLTTTITPRGAFAIWLPGSAGRAVTAALGAGLRLEDFPILLCWDRPFGDFERYLPISPGLL